MPWLDYVFVKNPLKQLIQGGSTTAVARFARDRMSERLSQPSEKASAASSQQKDFLTRFLEAKKTYPETVTDAQVFSYTVSNMNAGSDTTAISLRAILYYTLKTPQVKAKLMAELLDALHTGKLTLPVSWKQSQELPYLDAVVKEALRLHPAVGLLLERIVPAGGLQLPNGPFLPPGTIVGINPWIIHRHAVFGSDVDSFVPERWLRGEDETEAAFQARRQDMLRATLTFGAGPRTCIGKNISLLEIYKLIPSLLLTYEVGAVLGGWVLWLTGPYRSSWTTRRRSGRLSMRGLCGRRRLIFGLGGVIWAKGGLGLRPAGNVMCRIYIRSTNGCHIWRASRCWSRVEASLTP